MSLPPVVIFDLDDTLFPEHAYVRRGFEAVGAEVRRRFGRTDFAALAWELFVSGLRGRVFDETLARLDLPADPSTVRALVEAYRAHDPNIVLYPDAQRLLRRLRAEVCVGLVSDGPLVSQRRKIEALGLASRLDPLILTDRWGRGYWKPHERAFRKVEAVTGCSAAACVYVGDNPAKDFLAPRKLGWRTVRVRRIDGEHAGVPTAGAADVECVDLESFETVVGNQGSMRDAVA
jgi:putative hydrolase of the HAD superfamily